ncbi:hypothetical protein, partial [Mycolicibacter engbaekii]
PSIIRLRHAGPHQPAQLVHHSAGRNLKLRTDMWPFWLEDAIEAASAASQAADRVPQLLSQTDEATGETQDRLNRELDRAMINELRATMRAITASAFALDAFYATVKSRCGPHPHNETWQQNGTAREKRIAETLKYHFCLKAKESGPVQSCVEQVFKFRDWAVHMAAEFRDPVYREDVESSVDWHFVVFRANNAINATGYTVQVLDYLVSILDRGGEDLTNCKTLAIERMDAIFDAYDQVEALPNFDRKSLQTSDEP